MILLLRLYKMGIFKNIKIIIFLFIVYVRDHFAFHRAHFHLVHCDYLYVLRLNLVYVYAHYEHVCESHLVYVVFYDDNDDKCDSECDHVEEELYDSNLHSSNMLLLDMVLSDTPKLVREAHSH